MQLLDSLTVYHKDTPRYIEIYQGDLTDMPPEEHVDVLVVSAFGASYGPAPGTLIDALFQKKIYLDQLADKKAVDLRENFSCWMSQPILVRPPGIQFDRILCFETPLFQSPPSIVGGIFQALMPFTAGEHPIAKIAMPILAAGRQYTPVAVMITALIDAAIHWMEIGMPITHLKIVEISPKKCEQMQQTFSKLKEAYIGQALTLIGSQSPIQEEDLPTVAPVPDHPFRYDLFISYAHADAEAVGKLVEELRRLKPDIRIFLDRLELNPGASWQQLIFEALDNCRKVIAVYTPHYLASKVCIEEFNIALFRHREAEYNILMPIYLRSVDKLPTYMKLIQFIDCRENDDTRLTQACKTIFERMSS
jgi:hypothetical protein